MLQLCPSKPVQLAFLYVLQHCVPHHMNQGPGGYPESFYFKELHKDMAVSKILMQTCCYRLCDTAAIPLLSTLTLLSTKTWV